MEFAVGFANQFLKVVYLFIFSDIIPISNLLRVQHFSIFSAAAKSIDRDEASFGYRAFDVDPDLYPDYPDGMYPEYPDPSYPDPSYPDPSYPNPSYPDPSYLDPSYPDTSYTASDSNCKELQFDCQDSLNTCLNEQQLCDGNADCEGGEDEINCGMSKILPCKT